jgi:hypothetical protein
MPMQVMILEDLEQIVLVHLAVKREGKEYERVGRNLFAKDSWGIACTPNLTLLHDVDGRGAILRTDDPRAVTCPNCQDTDAYKTGMARVRARGVAIT